MILSSISQTRHRCLRMMSLRHCLLLRKLRLYQKTSPLRYLHQQVSLRTNHCTQREQSLSIVPMSKSLQLISTSKSQHNRTFKTPLRHCNINSLRCTIRLLACCLLFKTVSQTLNMPGKHTSILVQPSLNQSLSQQSQHISTPGQHTHTVHLNNQIGNNTSLHSLMQAMLSHRCCINSSHGSHNHCHSHNCTGNTLKWGSNSIKSINIRPLLLYSLSLLSSQPQ